MWILAVAVGMLLSPENPDPGECPAGQVLVPGSLVMTTLPNGDTEGTWECKPAQKQLSDMGMGRVDTGTGFDGGVGPTSAVATAALAEAIPGITPEQIERYSKDPEFKAAAEHLAKTKEYVSKATATVEEWREKQKAMTDPIERQKAQIQIFHAEKMRIAELGAERIAKNNVQKIVVRLDPKVE